MARKMNSVMEQEILFYNSLSGDEKREYFVAAFTSELIFALIAKRKEEKLTQSDVAKAMGVKQAYISKLENMDKIPTLETVAKYLYALGIRFEEIENVSAEVIQYQDINPSFYNIPLFVSKESRVMTVKEEDKTYNKYISTNKHSFELRGA